ncbi:MAG: hypothetical protein HY316_09090 [Acidobacteria bacterium]|nr:hypothetical protein [Acidobacteriota bacterium]
MIRLGPHRFFFNSVLYFIAGLIVVLGGACSAPQQPTVSEEAAPAEQIRPADVEAFGVRLFRDDSGYQVEGQIQNNSQKFTLTEFQFKMVMQDCLDTGVCEILAEDVNAIATNVPAGQSAAFQAAPNFGDMPTPKGKLGWHYAVVDANGTTP